MHVPRAKIFRLWGLLGLSALSLALGGAACGGASCTGCMAPLEEPIPEAQMFNGAAQVRLTPSGVDFISTQLPTIIQSMASLQCDSGLADYVPCPSGSVCVDGNHCEESGQRLPLLGFRIPYGGTGSDSCDSEVCKNASADQCLVYVELDSFVLDTQAPNTVDVTINTRIWSTDIPVELTWHLDCPVSPDCDYKITDRQRPVQAPIHLRVNNPLQRMRMDFGDPEIELVDDDIDINGHLGCDILDVIKPIIFPLLRSTLRDALNSNISSTITSLSTESCQAPETCSHPAISYCDGDQLCRFDSDDSYVPALLGTEGTMALGDLLGEFAGEATGVDLSVGAGGYAEVVGEGVEVGLRGGTDVEVADCAPAFSQSLPEPPRLVFGNSAVDPVSGADVPFMMGMGVSDRLIEEIADGAVRSGVLCQRIDSGLSSYINTGALGLLASSLGRIARDGAKPALIEVLPRRPLSVDIGLGTTTVDPGDPDRSILDKPLFTLRAHDLDLDLYGYVDQRYVRFMTMRVDLAIGMGLDVDADNNLQILMSGPEDWLQNVRVLNSDLLTDDPDDIAAAVPSLIGTMLSQAAPDLNQVMALPDLSGFQLRDLLIRGVMEHLENGQPAIDVDGHNIYEFIGIFANLNFDPAAAGGPLGYQVNTLAQIETLEVPPAEAFAIDYPGGPMLPTLYIRAQAEGDDADMEYSYRVNGGFWRPYHHGSLLHITDPQLQLMGRHRVELRGRRVGAPATRDPSPAVIEVLIDPLAPELSLARQGDSLVVTGHDGLTAEADLQLRYRLEQGAWIDQLGLADIALPSGFAGLVEVELRDEAGNVSRASLGQLPQALLVQDPSEIQALVTNTQSGYPPPETAGQTQVQKPGLLGCSAQAQSRGWWLWLALVGLMCWRQRR